MPQGGTLDRNHTSNHLIPKAIIYRTQFTEIQPGLCACDIAFCDCDVMALYHRQSGYVFQIVCGKVARRKGRRRRPSPGWSSSSPDELGWPQQNASEHVRTQFCRPKTSSIHPPSVFAQHVASFPTKHIKVVDHVARLDLLEFCSFVYSLRTCVYSRSTVLVSVSRANWW